MSQHLDPINDALDRARAGPAFNFYNLQSETDEQRALRLNLEEEERGAEVFETARDRKEAAKEVDSATYGVAQWLAETVTLPADPDYIPPDSESNEFKEIASGIPPEYWPQLARARSERHMLMIKDDILRELEAVDKLQRDGWRGITNRIAMTLADPITLAVILANPAVSVLVRGGRLARTAKIAAAAGAENLGLETLLFDVRETKSVDDLYYALIGGIVMGGALGAVIPNRALYAAGKNAVNNVPPKKSIVKEISDALDDDLSVGAAEARVATPLSTEQASAALLKTPRLTGVETKVRFDWYAGAAKSENPYVRDLGSRLLADPVGTRGGVQEAAAEEFATLLKKRSLVKFYQKANPALQEALKGVAVGKRLAAADQFFDDVTTAVRAENFTDTPVGRTARGMSEAITDAANEAKRFGVKGFEILDVKPGYVPRIPKASKIEALVRRFGNKQVERLLAESFSRASDVDLKYALRIARGYIHGVRLRGAGVDRDFLLTLADKDIITDLMRKAGVSEKEIDEAAGQLKAFGEKDVTKVGKIARAKRRLDLDEATVMRLKDRDGVTEEINITSFFEKDARLLTRMYVSTVGGHAALARAGFRSLSDWEAYIRAARLYETDNLSRSGNAIDKEITKLEKVRSVIAGRPLIDYNNPVNALSHMTRDWAYLAQSGMFGFAQASEMGQVMVTGGLGLMLRSVPRMKAMFTRAADGKLNDSLAREIEDFVATGTDATLHSTLSRFAHEYDEMLIPHAEGLMGKTEPLRHAAAKAAGYASGLTPITIGMQRLQARYVAQRLVNTVFKRGRQWSEMRRRAMGLTPVMEKRVFAQIKKHVLVRPSAEAGKELHRLDLARWDDLDARDALVLAIQRETHRSVLVPTLGASLPTINSTEFGKIVTQFMTFAIQAHSRLLVHGVKHMDAERSIAWFVGTGLAGMAYVSRTHLESLGRKDRNKFLRERLSAKRIAAAAFNMSGFSALLPPVIDTVLSVVPGGDPIFSYARTSGLGTSFTDLGRYPAGAIVQGVGNAVTSLRDGELTQSEWRQAQRMIPFARVLGIRNALNIIGQELPED